MIDYPTNLPQPSTAFTGRAETPIFRTEGDNGLIEQYGRFSTGREEFNVRWELSESELVIFEEWFNETLAGGVLIFGLMLPEDDGYSIQPVRFIGGTYQVFHKKAFFWDVSARVEKMLVNPAASNRTPPVAQWQRLAVDPTESQILTTSHRNALLVVRPASEDQTTLRILPPSNPSNLIYFGISNQGDGETLITSEDVPEPITPVVPSWPGSLPNVNQSFRMDAKRDAARLEMESGHTRQYSEADTTTKTHEVAFDFTLEQLQTFQDFFYVSLESGSLPFMLTMPVDGQFIPVMVRFAEGKFTETYIFHDRFRVTAKVDRIVNQTVSPPKERPYPLYYGPTVEVSAHRKMLDAQGKFFVVNPSEGETIKLHIYDTTPEFGLLIVGLGNVLITRGPFLLSIGEIGPEAAQAEFLKPSLGLQSVIVEIGEIENELATADFSNTPTLDLREVLFPIGEIENESAQAEFNIKPTLDLRQVIVQLDSIASETANATFSKPITYLGP